MTTSVIDRAKNENLRLLASEMPMIFGVEGGRIESPRAPLSDPIEALLATVEQHAVEETHSVEAYRRLAETTPDPIIALLMQIIIADEDRHHHLLERMAASLSDALEWRHTSEALPSSDLPPAQPAEELIQATDRWIKEEHHGARELRHLAGKERRLHGGLFSLLLESMAIDSDKHERMLTFIRDRLKAAR